MSRWKSVKAKQLLAALLRIGWEVAWQKRFAPSAEAVRLGQLHVCLS